MFYHKLLSCLLLSHTKKTAFTALALFIILAAFYNSFFQEETFQKHKVQTLSSAPLKECSFEAEQCLIYEKRWRQKAINMHHFLKKIKNEWQGPFVIRSVRLKNDLWEVILHTQIPSDDAFLPEWFAQHIVLMQQRHCGPKGCEYSCRLFITES
jgi:hypothetical protein